MKLRGVEARGSEKRKPIGRPGGVRAFLFFRRDRLEIEQTAFGVKLKIDHAGKNRRRIGEGDNSGSEGLIPKAIRAHFARTLPKPVAEHRRLFRQHAIPLGTLRTILFKVSEKIVVVSEAAGSVDRRG